MSMATPRREAIEVHGTVLESLPNATIHVALDKGQRVLAHTSGALRMQDVPLAPGAKVALEISPYDLNRGRITYRTT